MPRPCWSVGEQPLRMPTSHRGAMARTRSSKTRNLLNGRTRRSRGEERRQERPDRLGRVELRLEGKRTVLMVASGAVVGVDVIVESVRRESGGLLLGQTPPSPATRARSPPSACRARAPREHSCSGPTRFRRPAGRPERSSTGGRRQPRPSSHEESNSALLERLVPHDDAHVPIRIGPHAEASAARASEHEPDHVGIGGCPLDERLVRQLKLRCAASRPSRASVSTASAARATSASTSSSGWNGERT